MQALKTLKPSFRFYAGHLQPLGKFHTSLLASGHSDIKNFYKNRNVFITGGTGFMGKVLIEKILRSCPEIGNVYLLIRPKEGLDTRSRIEELLNNKIFERLKLEQPKASDKLIAISGDASQPRLGMSENEERQLIENVSVIFNGAASLKFNDTLRAAVKMNSNSVLNILDLCHKMPNLEALVDLSTAYCNTMGEVEEKIYPVSSDASALIKAISECWMTDEMQEALTKIFIKDKIFTYCYSKALAENVLLQERQDIPVAIIRPGLVSNSWKEPYPGWGDSHLSWNGVVLAAMSGILRTIHLKSDTVLELIPVDVSINLIIASAWHLAKTKPKEIPVYHSTSGDIQPLTYGQWAKQCTTLARNNPTSNIFLYPKITVNSGFFHWVTVLFMHYVPAVFADNLSKLQKRKPRVWKVHQNLKPFLCASKIIEKNKYKCKTGNQWKIWKDMSDEDKKEFNFDLRQLDWPTYIEHYHLGLKKYYLKEEVTMTKASQNLRRKLYIRNLMYLLGILCSGGAIGVTYFV